MAVRVNETQHAPTIVAPASRVLGYDLARAFAILGMVLVHFGLVMSADGWQQSAWAPVMEFLDGRAAATFVVLAGIGITLRASKVGASEESLASLRTTLVRRGVYLFVCGMLLLIIWPGDILRVYGIAMSTAAWFVPARPSRLWAAICSVIGGFLVLFVLLDYGRNWDWDSLTYHNLWTVNGQIRNLFYDGFRSVFPWAAFLFFGMWLGRQDLQHPHNAKRFLVVALTLALTTEIGSRFLVSFFSARAEDYGTDHETVVALFGTVSMPPLPIFLVAAGSGAVALICACLLLSQWFEKQLLVQALVATGQLAFTWYIGHIVLGLGAILVLGLESQWPLWVGLVTGLGFFVAAAALSLLYKQWFRHGPLEWLMRTVAG